MEHPFPFLQKGVGKASPLTKCVCILFCFYKEVETNTQVITLVNQKGAMEKSISCINLSVGLAQAEKKVLLADMDFQANLTISLD